MKNSKKTIPIFVSHQGCPNDCIFCNQRRITGVSKEMEIEEMRNLINSYLDTIPRSAEVEIAFFGGSFTAIEDKRQLELLQLANSYIEKGLVSHIRISTRPDCINNEILDRLKKYGVSIIELGVQSMDLDVLAISKRGHDVSCVFSSSKLILEKGFKLGLQIMLGLPLDSETKIMNTVKNFIDIKPNFVRIYPVVIVKDTELEEMYFSNKYKPWELEYTANLTKKLYLIFKSNNIDVIRMGLQSSDSMTLGKDIIAGPYHPAFGEIVYSLVYRDIIESFIDGNLNNEKTLDIKISNTKISKLVGQNKSNIKYFKEHYNLDLNIVTIKDESLYINNKKINLEKFYV